MSVVEVFADVCCPFTHVGLRRIVDRRRELGRDGPRLRVRAWPLELVNAAPLNARLVADEIDDLRAQVASDLFTGFDPQVFPATSLPAFALVNVAYERDLATGEEVSLELRTLLFERARDVADPNVLDEVADRHALREPTDDDRRRAIDDWHEGQARGVIGSPHFFVGGAGLFCPMLHIDTVDGRLRIKANPGAIDTFLDAALDA